MIIVGMNPNPLHSANALTGGIRLIDWGVIRAQGADAASFLHGQLTQDMQHLRDDRAQLAGYCSAKGRLLASFVVIKSAPQEFLLLCSADLLAPTLKRLSMFVLRAKCKLSDASAELAVHGLVGDAATSWLASAAPASVWGASQRDTAHLVRLPEAMGLSRYLLVQAGLHAAPALAALSPSDWSWLEVRSGVARITAATVEQFVPQMVNLELVDGVNFQKGCYPGQEIVARSQYRGTVKRRAMLFDSDASLAPGQEVFHSDEPNQPAGMVANAAARPDGTGSCALVQVKLAAVETGSLHLGQVNGPLMKLLPLPYPIPADAN